MPLLTEELRQQLLANGRQPMTTRHASSRGSGLDKRPAYEWLIFYGRLDRHWEITILRFQRCLNALGTQAREAKRFPRPLPALMYRDLANKMDSEIMRVMLRLLRPMTATDALVAFPEGEGNDLAGFACWTVRDWFFDLEPAVDTTLRRFRPYVPLPPEWQ